VQWKKSVLRWALITAVGLLVLLVFLLLFSPLLFLEEIKIRRLSPRLDIEQVQQVLSPLFGQHLLFLTKGDVKQLLKENVNDIDSIEMQKDYPSQLIVTIRLDPLVARLQIIDPDAEEDEVFTGSGIDFLTAKGVYITAINSQEGEGLDTVHLVDWGVRPSPGTELIPPETLTRLRQTQQALTEQFGLSVEKQTIYLRAQEYHMLTDGTELWFDMKSSLEQHLQRYRIFLQSVSQSNVHRYIDLRLTDRIVYM
tara:strand:+ start:197 stop:955 length:759 start_codon:yes stop_codon:yes gene_type:complete